MLIGLFSNLIRLAFFGYPENSGSKSGHLPIKPVYFEEILITVYKTLMD